MTKREAIVAAVRALLVNVPGVANANVYRSRVDLFSRAQTPAISVEPIRDLADSLVVPMLDWTLQLRVTVIVRGAIPDQVADPIIESIHEKISVDLSLGGLCLDIIPVSVNYELQDGDQPVGVVSLDYSIRYRTSQTDLSV